MRRLPAGAIFAACLGLTGCGGSSNNPAATVNGHDIPMRSYDIAFNTQRIRTADAEGYDACALKSFQVGCDLIRRRALDSLINKEIVREYARSHHISVSNADVNRRWQIAFRGTFRNRTDVMNAYLRRLNLTDPKKPLDESVQDLKAGVADDLLQQRVLYAVTGSVPIRTNAVRLAVIEAAVKVLPAIQAQLTRKPFLVVATAEVNNPLSGCRNLRCGELGWVPIELVPPDRIAVATARTGALVGPFLKQQYFELYRVEGRSGGYTMTQPQQYGIRVQRFNQWLIAQQHQAKVTRHIAA